MFSVTFDDLSRNVAFGLLIGICLVHSVNCDSAPHDIVSSVPIGIKLSDLDGYLKRGSGSEGEVLQWIPTNEPADSKGMQLRGEGMRISTEFGTFLQKNLGSYDEWYATAEDRNRFTGEITFIHHGSTSSDINSFTFVNGILRKKDWGYLPG